MSEGFQGAGFSKPASNRYVQLARPMLIGDTYFAAGDVVEVQPADARPAAIMPVDPRLYTDRAQKLIDARLAKAHPGPSTVELGRSLRRPDEPPAVERAVNPAPRRAERATAAPQRGAI